MRRILMSSREEFNYPSSTRKLKNLAVKKLALFYESANEKEQTNDEVTVSNKCNHLSFVGPQK